MPGRAHRPSFSESTMSRLRVSLPEMRPEIAGVLLSGFVTIVAAATAAEWNRWRARSARDGRAIRKAARELYRDLDAATAHLPRLKEAKSYGELLEAFPIVVGWPNLRRILADHATEIVWMEIAYGLDRLFRDRAGLRRTILRFEGAGAEVVPRRELAETVRDVEEALRNTLSVLEVLLPGDVPSVAAQRLGPFEDEARNMEKLRLSRSIVRRGLANAQPRSSKRKVRYETEVYDPSRFWRSQ